MEEHKESNLLSSFLRFCGLISIVISIVILPWTAHYAFWLGEVRSGEWTFALISSIILFVFGYLLMSGRIRFSERIAFGLFTFQMLFFLEWLVRLIVIFSGGNTLQQQINWNKMTYSDQQAYVGHPYLQFVGKSGNLLKGSEALSDIPQFNSYGFPEREFQKDKEPGVIRIVCVGESTTADGYPIFLERFLNDKNNNPGNTKFEVLNFAHAGWNTTNSVVNLIVNIVDIKPDYLVIHHGWNEERIRGFSEDVFRSDYTHVMKPLESAVIYDRYLIRYLSIYRFFKSLYDRSPSWMGLGTSIEKEVDRSGFSFDNLSELEPFKRNISIMLEICYKYGIKPVIVTIPFSTDVNITGAHSKTGLEQTNGITREIAASHGKYLLVADLDKEFTGKINHVFTDFAHVNDDGRTIKASFIGKKIMDDWVFWNPKSGNLSPEIMKQERLRYYEKLIRNNKEWMTDVERKALDRNITLDSMITLDALYMIELNTSK